MKKVIVCGPYNAGKTSLIKNINPEEFQGTEEREFDVNTLEELSSTTTVGIEMTSFKFDGKEVLFIGLPGQEKFSFLWETIGSKYDGILFLIPSTATLKTAALYIDYFSKFDSFKRALKRLVITYPEKLSHHKKQTFSLLGIPTEVVDPTNRKEVEELVTKLVKEL